jgi:serine protease Do
METTNTNGVHEGTGSGDFQDMTTDRILPAVASPSEFAQPTNVAEAEQQLWGTQGAPSNQALESGLGTNLEQSPQAELGASASTAAWNPVTQLAQPTVPPASPVPAMTPWTAATPVPPTAIQWPSGAQQRESEQQQSEQRQSAPQGSSYPQNSPSQQGPNGSTTQVKKSGWVKPALIGGLVGALTSGAILGGVLANTRNTNNETKQVTQASTSAGSTAAVVAPQVGGTKVVPALATSTGQADVPRIVSELSKSIVTINTKGFPSADLFGSSQVPEGAGTGIVLSKDGFVLTNAHVIADAQTIKVTVPGGKTCQADVVGRDRNNDVAVVKCRNVTDFVPAALGKSGDMKVGESVVAIGNALGLEGNPTVTTGILSATNRALEGDGERLTGLLQTDAAINPGNSGGPLVNARGQVVGMNTAIYQNTNNIGFAIPIDSILPIVEKIRSGEIGKPKTFLGVTTQTMDSDIQKQYSLGTDKGAIVVDVTVGSPAQNAGLQRGDIITKFDGVSITDNKQLGERVRKHKAGDVVDMTFMRGSQSINTKVTLGSALSDV